MDGGWCAPRTAPSGNKIKGPRRAVLREGAKIYLKINFFLSSIGLVFIGKLRQLLIVRVNSP